MAVGFGYIRDDKPTQIDWGQITKDATEALKGIEKDRQGRRDKIEEDQKEFTKMLMERPVGGDTVYQQLMGKYTTMVSKAMLDKMNQLKRGDITEQEFTTFRGTVTSGANGMMAGAKAYVEGFDTSAELAAGDGSALTNWGNAKNQRLFSLEGITPMVDPISGETTFFVLDEDGEKEVVDMSQFLKRSVNKQTAFDTKGAIDTILDVKANTFEDDLGGIVSGKLLVEKEIKDAEGKVIGKEVVFDEEFVRKQAQASVQQNTHVFDILVKDVTGYDIQALPTDYYNLQTKEERDAYMKELQQDTSVLYVDNNDNPIVSDAQRREAEDYILEQVKGRSEFSKKEKAYMAQKIIDLDIGWREATIEKVNKEAAQVGEASKVPAIKAYTKGFFDFTKKDDEGNVIPNEVVDNVEDVLQQGLGKFNFRQISYEDEVLTFYPVQGGKPFVLDLKTEGKTPDELAEDLTLIVLANRGLKPVIQQAIIDGALTDETSTGEKPGVDYSNL